MAVLPVPRVSSSSRMGGDPGTEVAGDTSSTI